MFYRHSDQSAAGPAALQTAVPATVRPWPDATNETPSENDRSPVGVLGIADFQALRGALVREGRGPYIPTASGGKWYFLDPDPADVYIDDIAAGLSRLCRYSGQIADDIEMLSVAEHSTLMTEFAIEEGLVTTREEALEVHLHDAPEAYLGEMTSPLKLLMPDYKTIEEVNAGVIRQAFRLPARPEPAFIKRLDRRIVLDERDAAINWSGEPWAADRMGLERLGVTVEGWSPRWARRRFLEAYERCERLPVLDGSRRAPGGPPDLAQATPALREDVKVPLRDEVSREAENSISV